MVGALTSDGAAKTDYGVDFDNRQEEKRMSTYVYKVLHPALLSAQPRHCSALAVYISLIHLHDPNCK